MPPIPLIELVHALEGHAPRNHGQLSPLPLVRRGSKAEKRRAVRDPKQAKILEDCDLELVFDYIDKHSRCPESDKVKVLLSFKAGLRVGEISALTMNSVTDAGGRLADNIFIGSATSKSLDDRYVPMHPDLAAAISVLRTKFPTAEHLAFSVSRTGKLRRQYAANLAGWFGRLYREAGLIGCSSHSGRRTFATRIARQLNSSQLELLQKWMGHRHLSTTQGYIEPSANGRALIESI